MWLRRIAEEIHFFLHYFPRSFPAPALQYASPAPLLSQNQPAPSFMDSILWAVPKSRRSLERRMTRRFGSKKWGTSKLVPMNRKIRTDNATGEYFELGILAPRSFRTIMSETEAIQKKMKDLFGKGPKNSEVGVTYVGENSNTFGEGTRIIEMESERPKFFSRNLLEKAGHKKGSTTVRPTGLG